jgi:hypothetical protein
MIRRAITAVPWLNISLVAIGATIAAIVAPLVMFSVASLTALYDQAFPVAEARLAEATHVDEGLRLRLYVTRFRDCETLKVEGFSGNLDAMVSATMMRREDGEAPISYPVGVTVLSRPWIMSPIFGPHIWIYGYYGCGGRVVKQRLIDQPIP